MLDAVIEVRFSEERFTVGEGEREEVCVEMLETGVLLPPGGTVDVLVATAPRNSSGRELRVTCINLIFSLLNMFCYRSCKFISPNFIRACL